MAVMFDDSTPGCSKTELQEQQFTEDGDIDLNRVYQCSICQQFYESEAVAVEHFQQCSVEQHVIREEPPPKVIQPITVKRKGHRFDLEVLACQECTFWSLQEDKMHAHIVSDHNSCGAYSYRNAIYLKPPDPNGLQKNLYNHQKACFICNLCPFRSTNYGRFKSHVHAQATKADLELYECFFCSFACSQPEQMDTHCEETHSILKTLPPLRLDFRCATCRCVFNDPDALSAHMASCEHTIEDEIEKNFPHVHCTECCFGTNAKQLLEFHRQLLHTSYPCADCQEVFNTKKELSVHCHERHAHQCSRCNVGFPTRQAYLRHEEEKHPLPYVCDICGNKMAEESELLTHIAGHTSTMCSLCDKTFPSVTDLKSHTMEIHPKNNMLGKNVCNGCFHVFSTPEALNKHVEDCPVVAGLCVQCGDACGSIDTLLEHVKDNHKEMDIHKCDSCGYRTIDSTVHMNHLMIHLPLPPTSGASRYQCDICEKWTSSAGSLRTHVNNHNKLKPYRCEFCEFVTSSGGNLRAHRAVRHLSTAHTVKCNICNRRYRTIGQMNKHIKKTHNQTLSHQCEFCENRFVTATRLMRHLAIVHFEDVEAVTGREPYAGLTRFRCDDCPYSSYSANRYRLHKATHRDRLKCPYCDLNFPLFDVMNRHINSRHLKKQVSCTICHRRLPDDLRLSQHIEACHVDGTPEIRCETCGYCFESLAHLEYHQRIHITAKNFECANCKRCFTTAASLCVHRLRHTKLDVNRGKTFMGNSNWVFSCDLCRLRFKYKSSLLAHQSAVHSDNEDLCCQYCNKGPFSSKLLLGYHIRKHLQERSFACDHCSKKFFAQSSLNNHVVSVHTKAYKIFCTLCNKGMLSQLRLRLHMLHAHKETPTKRKPRQKKPKFTVIQESQLPEDSIILEAHPDDLIAADENILSQEIVISTIEETGDDSAEPSDDFISQIFDTSCADSPHLVQITVGADGDQIGEVEFGEYVIE